MGKHEAPPFRMVIENGRLVPSAAWDQERLATYRNGSTVSVRLTQEKNRKLERKYWAILGEVIKSCPIKQRNAEDLHKAIRLKLGIVDAFFSMDGKLRVEIKSTSGMEEPEYREFFEEAMRLLHEETGVDPLTLHLESADVGEDEPSSEPRSPAPDDAGDVATARGTVADEPAAGGMEERADPDSPPADPGTRNKMEECRDKFLAIAANKDLDDDGKRATARVALDAWKAELPAHGGFVKACLEALGRIVKGGEAASERTYLDGLIERAVQ